MAILRMMPCPISLLILNALYKGFQMRYHLFQKFFGKMVKIKETSFLSTRGMYLSCHGCKHCQKLYWVQSKYLQCIKAYQKRELTKWQYHLKCIYEFVPVCLSYYHLTVIKQSAKLVLWQKGVWVGWKGCGDSTIELPHSTVL